MKKIFEILQKGWCSVILLIIFGGVQKWTIDFGLTATWIVLVSSILVLLLVLWNLLAKWEVKKQGFLIANLGASFIGVTHSLIVFAFVYGKMTQQEVNLLSLVSFCMGIALCLWGMYWDWCKRPWDEDKQKVSPLKALSPK